MIKKIILSAMCFLAAALPASAADGFTVKSIPCPEGEQVFNEDYQKFDSMLARYADDKTPVALSMYYDGYMFATVPEENKDREIETFYSEPVDFADKNDDDYRFYDIERLSRAGVITGDENKNANAESNITRAEAAAMIMRFLGVSQSGKADSGFSDVAEDAWYALPVARAKEYKIIQGDSETTFSPERNVSREELTQMAARAVYSAKLRSEKAAAREDLQLYDEKEAAVMDIDKVSDWAINAYALFGYQSLITHDENDYFGEDGNYIPYEYYEPQKAATRVEAAELLNTIQQSFQIYPSRAAVKFGFDKQMPKIDGSTSTYPFTQAIYYNLFSNGNYHESKPEKHSKSHVSYEKLINKELDAIIASVYPAEDILALAKENNVELELIPIAYDAMIFFTNADNSAKGLTQPQITDIYVDNKYSNWKELGGEDALLYPYARNYDSGSHAQMERHFLKGKDINSTIREETTSVAMSNILTDVMAAQTDNPKGYGLGYSIYYYFKNMDVFYNTSTDLKLLEIDGVYPTDETISNGSYPLSNNTYVVIRKDEKEGSPARRFAEFMLSDVGQQCVEEAGFGAINPPQDENNEQ